MPTSNVEDVLPEQGEAPVKRKSRVWIWILGGIVWLLLCGASGGFVGYRAAIQQRLEKEQSQIALKATEQFQLAVQDINNKQYTRAQQRLEYVIQLDSGFPGAVEKLSEVMLAINLAKTPTATPVPTLTPTPDLRGVEDRMNQAKKQLAEKDWPGAIATLDALRKEKRDYQAIAVDGMYYLALRNRGVDKILRQGKLEGGIYDLTMASRYGPIDAEAAGFITWARIYLAGASYWDVDWKQAAYYFEQVYPALPNLRDGSGLTAIERFRTAQIKYGDQLATAGEYCMARDAYEKAAQAGPLETAQPTLDWLGSECSGGGEHQGSSTSETPSPTVTPTPPGPATVAPPTVAPPTETQPPPTATETPKPAEATAPVVEPTAG